MRSLLFVPVDQPRKLEKAAQCGADALILDLEDSVAPAAKQAARDAMAAYLQAERTSLAPDLFVRVNALETGLTQADLAAALPFAPDGIVLPKSAGRADVRQLAALLRVEEARCGLQDGSTGILAIMTESARAVFEGRTYAGASDRLMGLTWGAEDLSADIGAIASRDTAGGLTDVFRLARAVTVLAAAAAGVPAIDTVFVDIRDEDGLRDECLAAARDGFTAKMAIHPAQVPVINSCFSPLEEAVAEARAVVAAFAGKEKGVAVLNGKMIDRPHLRRAENILARVAEKGPNARK